MMFTTSFVHFQGCLSQSSSVKIPEMTTSWCLILQTVLTNALVDHGGFPLQVAMNWSRSSLATPAVHSILGWPPSTLIWSYSHPTTCCFMFLLLPVLRTVPKCAFWVIFSVTAIAASWWTNCSLGCCSVSPGGALVEVPVIALDSDPIAPGWCVSGAMTCWCGKVRKMIMQRSGKSWRLYS